jgi:hypothetical protein
MRSVLSVIVLLAGCDRLLKLDDITPRDAMRGDDADGMTAGDAQSVCPTTGAPQFGGMHHALPELVNCISYTIGAPGWSSSELAIASCGLGIFRDDAGVLVMQLGVTGFTTPVVTPTGELCASSTAGITCFQRSATPETWEQPQVQTFDGIQLSQYDLVSAPSGAPQDSDRRILRWDLANLTEYRGANGVWATAATVDSSTLGVAPAGGSWLSSDGLRVVFPAMAGGLYYARRAVPNGPFGTALEIYVTTTGQAYPFMTADCGRLYYEDTSDFNIYWVGRL